MRSEITVSFGPQQVHRLPVEAPMSSEAARAWLDEQYVEMDCVPTRASGKVLVADKLLALADVAGPELFERDPVWSAEYAQAAAGATGRARVLVDVLSGAVSY
ncbi:hypothetical protein C7444_106196 [Sphaerotilus hippei]|uniref:Uncharacterized protein n=1 Tax=Sphaerotilus hippei TaxID=744406 RepID=A0A318H192_9BURK|nr:hypothetical protein [Sphaerotilus hippei]PXW96674.1 hypothetical protein C7444_106196 [Sphaerotilus hippei]